MFNFDFVILTPIISDPWVRVRHNFSKCCSLSSSGKTLQLQKNFKVPIIFNIVYHLAQNNAKVV